MNVVYVPLTQVDPNPWQTRQKEDPVHIAKIAESMAAETDIGEAGMLHVPMARFAIPDSLNSKDNAACQAAIDAGARVQLTFGMTRCAAWKIAHPDKPFPVQLEMLTDKRMSDLAAKENSDRQDLNPIEKAKAIQRRMKEFNLTQAEAGAPFGYKSDSSVSKLLNLLNFEEPVQEMVQERTLAEHDARLLVAANRVDPAAVVKIAKKSAKMANPTDFISHEVDQLLDQKALSLVEAPWDLKWPKNALPMDVAIEGLTELPACIGCPFFFTRNANVFCGRRECFEAKLRAKMPEILGNVAAKLGLTVAVIANSDHTAGPDADIVPFYQGGGYNADNETRARGDYANVKNPNRPHDAPELRVMPVYELPDGRANRNTESKAWERKHTFGTAYACVGTVDPSASEAAVAKLMKKAEPDKPPEKKKNETKAETAKRTEAERKQADSRRTARIALHQNKMEVIWLTQNAAKLIAEQLEIHGTFVEFVEHTFTKLWGMDSDPLKEWDAALLKEIQGSGTFFGKKVDELTSGQRITLHKTRLVLHVIGSHVSDYQHHYKSLAEVRKIIATLLGDYPKATPDTHKYDAVPERFGVKLAPKWDAIPILNTEANCWFGPEFAPGEKLTGKDLREGWMIIKDKKEGGQVYGVACSKHRGKLANIKLGKDVVRLGGGGTQQELGMDRLRALPKPAKYTPGQSLVGKPRAPRKTDKKKSK